MLWLEIYFEFHVSFSEKSQSNMLTVGECHQMHNLNISIFNLKFLDKQKDFECAIILCLNRTSLLKYGVERWYILSDNFESGL